MRRHLDLAGVAAIVTGASSGIGLATAQALAARGARVGLLARNPAALRDAAATIGGETATATADVADAAAVADAIAALEAALAPATVLVNNAGHGAWGAVAATDAAEFRRAIDVNYLGTVHATAAVLPGMLARGRGRIVNVASIAGRIGAPFEAAYSASKFAVVGYSEALSVELTGTGVTVSLVDPGPVETEFFGRRGHPYELRRPRPIVAARVADAVVRAAERGTSEQYLPRWLRLAGAVKTVAPPLHRFGARRAFRSRLSRPA